MTYRQVLQHPDSKKWAFIEFRPGGHETILGGKEFGTSEEAEEYSKGFDLFSYEWKDPKVATRDRLEQERAKLQARLAEIEQELG